MSDSIIFKTVNIGEDEYLIRKFTAKEGLKIARLIIAKAAPLIPLLQEGEGKEDEQSKQTVNDDRIYTLVGEILETLSDEDLDSLVDKCMRVCSKVLPAGPQAIIDTTGHYGVPDVEHDIVLTLRLCIEAIKWGASDFFAGKGSILSRLTK